MPRKRSPDVIVIGAGAIGGSVAYQLTRRGLTVRILEANGIASGATGASEGLVGSIAKRKSGPVTDIVVKSFAMFPNLVAKLGDEIEFCRKPGLIVIDDERHVGQLKRFAEKRRHEGLRIEWLDCKSVHEAEPRLSPAIIGGLLTPDQGAVNPIRLTHCYIRAAKERQATLSVGTRVTGLDVRAGRIERVLTTTGAISAGLVINAAGAEASSIAAFGSSKLEITPKRAQMIVSETLPPGTLRNTIYIGANLVAGLDPGTLEFEDVPGDKARRKAEIDNHCQLSSFTQTKNGNVLFCGGFGFAGSTRDADPTTIATMARNIAAVVPSFGAVRILRGWAGLEPCTPSNLPTIGFAYELSNLVHAAGHGNAGVMMSPYTGCMVADQILGDAVPSAARSAQPQAYP
jgi:sarcosine oxidase subunit beta